ncbi:MAG: hypothetical protein JOZ96_11620 [Acidobacteria bacterium]|nr:hypothetical protein [Acidobacteriota bacterium]
MLLLVLLSIISSPLSSFAQPTPATNANSAPLSSEELKRQDEEHTIQELERSKRLLELQQQIEKLRGADPQKRTNQYQDGFIFTIMASAFSGSALASLGLIIYLFTSLLGITSSKPKESDTSEETLGAFNRQALAELRWYSAASLLAMMFGIAIIFGGAILALAGLTPAAIVSAVAGIVTEGVALLFHKQTDKIRVRVEKIERQLLSIKMAKEIEDKAIQDKAIGKMLDAGLNSLYLPPARRA